MQTSSVVDPHSASNLIRGRSRSNTWTNGGRDRTRAVRAYREKQHYLSFSTLDSEDLATPYQLQLQAEQLSHRIHQLNIDLLGLSETHNTLDSFDAELKCFERDYRNYFPWRAKHPPRTRRETPDRIMERRAQFIWQRGEPSATSLQNALASLKGRIKQFSALCCQDQMDFAALNLKLRDLFSKARKSLDEEELNQFLYKQRPLLGCGKIINSFSELPLPKERIDSLLRKINYLKSLCDIDCLRYFQREEFIDDIYPYFRTTIQRTANHTATDRSTYPVSAPAV